jgi:dGTPase
MENAFIEARASELDSVFTQRLRKLYNREGDVRNPFARDYTRILHSYAFRRLKHKTQVFFNIAHDHICTRMEHVLHVESVATTIVSALGLNVDLTRAIALGHDLGHAPFGHSGERVIQKILQEEFPEDEFWHERHGLYIVDNLELLEDDNGKWENLDLTFAVRDGILSHCGEIDEAAISPRSVSPKGEDLTKYVSKTTQPQPATWEGCVVKISDKIAYLGRDISDALQLGFIALNELDELKEIAHSLGQSTMNTTVTIHSFVSDIINNSSPERGICLSDTALKHLDNLKQFNYRYIYRNERFDAYNRYCALVITEIYRYLMRMYESEKTISNIVKAARQGRNTDSLYAGFLAWVIQYCDTEIFDAGLIKQYPHNTYCNEKIYKALDTKPIFTRAVIDYISEMTDRFAVESHNSIISYS